MKYYIVSSSAMHRVVSGDLRIILYPALSGREGSGESIKFFCVCFFFFFLVPSVQNNLYTKVAVLDIMFCYPICSFYMCLILY